MVKLEPSSANTGFIQNQPVLKNQFHDDVSLKRVVKRVHPVLIPIRSCIDDLLVFLPTSILDRVSPEISKLGDQVLSQQIFNWVTDAEKNQPYIRGGGRDAFGRPKGELVVTEGWRKLQDFGFEKGYVTLIKNGQ